MPDEVLIRFIDTSMLFVHCKTVSPARPSTLFAFLLPSLLIRSLGFLSLYPNFFLPAFCPRLRSCNFFSYSFGPLLTSHCLASRTSTIPSSMHMFFRAKITKRRKRTQMELLSFHKLARHCTFANKSKRPSGRCEK